MRLFRYSDFLNFLSPFSLLPLWLPCSESILVALPSSHLWQTCHTGAGHRDALVIVSGGAQLPWLPQGEGEGKARRCSPCSLGRALSQPRLDRGIWTSSEVALPGICMLALGNRAPENIPFSPQHPLAQVHAAAAAPTLTNGEQPAPLQTKETCIRVKEVIKKYPLAQEHFHWGRLGASLTHCSVGLPCCHTWV